MKLSASCEMTVLSKLIIERCVINSCHGREEMNIKLTTQNSVPQTFSSTTPRHIVSPQMQLLLLYSLNIIIIIALYPIPTVLAARKGGDNKDPEKLHFPTRVHQPGWRSLWEILKSAFSRENDDSINS